MNIKTPVSRYLRAIAPMMAAAAILVGGNAAAQVTGGSLDTSFSGDGKVGCGCDCGIPFPFPPSCASTVSAMALQPDGKYVLAGGEGLAGQGGTFGLSRYLSDGAFDSAFGTVETDFSSGFDFAFAVAVQPDGKIVAAGSARGDPPRFALARYLSDGSLDPDFSEAGLVQTPMGFGPAEARALVVQPDGKLVVVGAAARFLRTPMQFALARYLPDGRLDAGFGVGGRAITRFVGGGTASGLALLPDGSLLVSGSVHATGAIAPGFAVVRYLADGAVDAGFGVSGRAVARSSQLGSAKALVVQADGKIVVGGSGRPPAGDSVFVLLRWGADGKLDPSFGAAGVVATPFASGAAELRALALQTDGKLVAAGTAHGLFALARYLPRGALDDTFGSGTVTTAFPGTSASVNALLIQPDGKIVAAGDASSSGGIGGGGGPKPAMARYLP